MLLMYLPEWIQKFKEPRTEIKKVGGHFYKYQVEYRYNKNKKRTDKITVGLLGKITQEEGFIPSDKHLLKLKEGRINDPEKVDIKMFGVYGLFSELLEEEIKGLGTNFSSKDLEVLLTVAMMRFAHEAPIKRMQRLHHHDYCSLFWHKTTLTDKIITDTLRYIGENRQLIIDWMRTRLSDKKESLLQEYIMIDSTHITTTSNLLNVNAIGYNPAKNFDEQIRLMYMFSSALKQPVYYRLINGNITDVSSMKLCVEEMNVENVIFIADKGFYSKTNIKTLNDNRLKYIIPLYRNIKLIDFTPLQQGDFKKKNQFFIYKNRVIWYYSYEKYKQRNEIEVMFDSYKNFLKADCMYMQNRMVLEGWLMANFIAMIAYYKLYQKLIQAKQLSKYSPKDIIEISKSISKVKINDQWKTAETTKKTRDLLEKLKIDYLMERS